MDQLRRFFEKLTWAQRIWLAAAVLALGGGAYWLNHWNQEQDFKPLFSNLDATDAGALVEQLKQSATPYRLSDNGATILVPSAQVAEVRLAMAAVGLPKTGRIGFELFDKANFGASDFAEQVNYHRAVEGELERSVMAIREVEQARVHVTWAKDSLYSESRQPAKASVLIKLRPGTKLAPMNVTAIAQLLASAVPDLSPDQVAIVDTSGALLNRPRKAVSAEEAGGEAALEYRKSVEKDLQNKVMATLEPLLGVEHVRAGAFVDVDITSGEQSEETFDPQKNAVATSQKTEDGPALPVASGVPGTASNLPRPTSTPVIGVTNYARKTESTSFQTSRLVRHTKLPQGNIKKVSLSVLVDHSLRWEGKKRIIDPPAPEKLKVIRDLVAAATGIDTRRGDQLVVESFPFEATLTAAPPETDLPSAVPVSGIPLPSWLEKFLQGKSLVLIASAAAGAFLFVAGGLAFLLLRKKKKLAVEVATGAIEGAAGTAQAKEALPSAEEMQKQMESKLAEQAALAFKNEAEELLKLKMPGVATKKTDMLSKYIVEETKKDPAHMAQVVRTWLTDGKR